jgi:hypothetical protein
MKNKLHPLLCLQVKMNCTPLLNIVGSLGGEEAAQTKQMVPTGPHRTVSAIQQVQSFTAFIFHDAFGCGVSYVQEF